MGSVGRGGERHRRQEEGTGEDGEDSTRSEPIPARRGAVEPVPLHARVARRAGGGGLIKFTDVFGFDLRFLFLKQTEDQESQKKKRN